MTDCYSVLNLKSSVYNQRGENLLEQLSNYNHMSTHLRKILRAKYAVDAKNLRYLQKYRQCESLERFKFLNDYSYHILSVLNCDLKHHQVRVSHSKHQTHSFSCQKLPIKSRESPQLKKKVSVSKLALNSPYQKSSMRKEWRQENENKREKFKSPVLSSRIASSCDNDEIYSDYSSSFESSPEASPPDSPKSLEDGSNLPKSDVQKPETLKVYIKNKSEDVKYSKFLYDITQEIVQNNLYSDEELSNVFQKYVNEYSTVLNKSKMLNALNQLKLSLNIFDEKEEKEDDKVIDESVAPKV